MWNQMEFSAVLDKIAQIAKTKGHKVLCIFYCMIKLVDYLVVTLYDAIMLNRRSLISLPTQTLDLHTPTRHTMAGRGVHSV